MMTLRLLSLLFASVVSVPVAVSAQTPSAVGEWRGTLSVPGMPGRLTLVFRTSQPTTDRLTSTFESVEQNATVPVRTTTQSGNRVVFDLPILVARFEGTLATDGQSIEGTWSQAGMSLPLRLERFTASSPGAALTSDAAVGTHAVADWVRTHAIPLKTVQAVNTFDDMQRLKAVIGDARIVALGEATHGTREFFQMKHRMLEFLVREMGFTTFAIEANLPEARQMNEYVLGGTGDPASALAGMYFWTWHTEEVLAMVEWMRAYNADPAHARKITFHGFDMQMPHVAATNVVAYLRAQDPEIGVAAAESLAPLSTPEAALAFRDAPLDEQGRVAVAVEMVLQQVDRLAPAAPGHGETPSTAFRAWREARQDAVVIRQMVRMAASPGGGYGERDEAMAANVTWILETEGPASKVVLWAHNAHVSALPAAAAAPAPMGWHLRTRFGREMAVFGFAFNRGAFQAIEQRRGLREFTVGAAPAGSLDATVAAAGIPLLALDLRPASGTVGDWLRAAQKTRSIGAVFDEEQEYLLQGQRTGLAFDALLFVDTTTRARPLP